MQQIHQPTSTALNWRYHNKKGTFSQIPGHNFWWKTRLGRTHWSSHCISCQNNKLAEIVKNFVTHKNKHLLYYAYIYSKIKYGIEVYGTANATQIKKVKVKQNRALKVLFNKDFLTPTYSLHKELEVLKGKDINKLHTAKFVHMQQIPSIFKNFLIANQTVHQHNTRQNHNLHINQPNTNNGKRTMKYHGATIWNALAGSLGKIDSNKTFGSQLKRILLANY